MQISSINLLTGFENRTICHYFQFQNTTGLLVVEYSYQRLDLKPLS